VQLAQVRIAELGTCFGTRRRLHARRGAVPRRIQWRDRDDSSCGPQRREHRELPVEELLRRVRPLPARAEMVIEDLTQEKGEAFLAAALQRDLVPDEASTVAGADASSSLLSSSARSFALKQRSVAASFACPRKSRTRTASEVRAMRQPAACPRLCSRTGRRLGRDAASRVRGSLCGRGRPTVDTARATFELR
jgi:hypothetical protein